MNLIVPHIAEWDQAFIKGEYRRNERWPKGMSTAYLRIVNIPMAATHSPTLTAITMMMAAARPVHDNSTTVISIVNGY